MYRITHGDPCVNGSRVPSDAADPNDECPFDHLVTRTVSRENRRSERLLAANAQLLTLRAKAANRPILDADYPQSRPVVTASIRPKMPAHLGWNSAQLTDQLAQTNAKSDDDPLCLRHDDGPHVLGRLLSPHSDYQSSSADASTPATPKFEQQPQTIVAHPSLLLAMLRHKVEAIGRIWLLARHLDQTGRGWLSVDDLRNALTNKLAPLRCIGWRRLRQLLTTGQGQFWERDRFGRIFLYGTARVAQQLNVERMTGQAVMLPVSQLTQPIATVRAHFYASFHSGRQRDHAAGMPISRETLTELTALSARSQRTYDRQLEIEKRSNYAAFDADPQSASWQQAVIFRHGDRWIRRLPNSYHATHQTVTTKQRKRINQRLQKDLVKSGTQGNDCKRIQRVFFANGAQAAANLRRGETVIIQAGKCGQWSLFESVGEQHGGREQGAGRKGI